MRLVEIRSYKLKPDSLEAFNAAVSGIAVPMLLRWNTEVVCFGPSAHETDTYFLIRAYASLADLEAQQNAFYGSAEWRDGPRELIVSRIESHLSTVLWLSESSVEDLRRSNPPTLEQH
jgi:NIPSNAP